MSASSIRVVACFLGGTLSSVCAACAQIDDVGELDVLSRPPVAGFVANDAGADVAAARDDVDPRPDVVEPRDVFTSCKMQSVACTVCMSTSRCFVEWGACLADMPCLQAIPIVRACNCDAQMFDAGSIALCGEEFQAVNPAAASLAACIISSCATDCGI
jgi:hypothetical protein